MVNQLRLAHTVKYISSKSDNQYLVTSKGINMNLVDSQCSCSFRTLVMPCRHIFAVRRSLSMSAFEEEMVGQRWLKSYSKEV